MDQLPPARHQVLRRQLRPRELQVLEVTRKRRWPSSLAALALAAPTVAMAHTITRTQIRAAAREAARSIKSETGASSTRRAEAAGGRPTTAARCKVEARYYERRAALRHGGRHPAGGRDGPLAHRRHDLLLRGARRCRALPASTRSRSARGAAARAARSGGGGSAARRPRARGPRRSRSCRPARARRARSGAPTRCSESRLSRSVVHRSAGSRPATRWRNGTTRPDRRSVPERWLSRPSRAAAAGPLPCPDARSFRRISETWRRTVTAEIDSRSPISAVSRPRSSSSSTCARR